MPRIATNNPVLAPVKLHTKKRKEKVIRLAKKRKITINAFMCELIDQAEE